LLDPELIDACIVSDRHEIMPRTPGISSWVAFLDAASGAGKDSMCLAVAGQEIMSDRPVLACLREWAPPFSPEAVCAECSTIMKSYGLRRVMSDRYALNWVSERLRSHGVTLEYSTRPKSDLYRELIPSVTSKSVDLLDNKKLRNQLMSLERRLSRAGVETIDAAGHEDLANAAAGALVLANEGGGGPLVGAIGLSNSRSSYVNDDLRQRQWAAYVTHSEIPTR